MRTLDVQKNAIEKTAEIIYSRALVDGGYTFRGDVKNPRKGYVVALHEYQEIVAWDKVDFFTVLDYVTRHWNIVLKNRRAFFGGWLSITEQKFYFDISEVIPSKDEAIRLANERHQLAIWDLFNQTEIETA